MAKHYLEQVVGRTVAVPQTSIMSLRVPVAGTLEKVTVYAGAIVSTTNTFDANLNGATLFSNQAHRPSITSGNQSADNGGGTMAQAVVVGDKLTVDADVVGESLQFVTVVFQIEDGTDYAPKNVVQNSQSAAYTLVLADAGKHILHPLADNNARTFTIPANSSVAYPIGTVLTFVNEINTVTIAINTDTLLWAGTSSTGSRTLAANGIATAIKITSTKWMIFGNGLT